MQAESGSATCAFVEEARSRGASKCCAVHQSARNPIREEARLRRLAGGALHLSTCRKQTCHSIAAWRGPPCRRAIHLVQRPLLVCTRQASCPWAQHRRDRWTSYRQQRESERVRAIGWSDERASFPTALPLVCLQWLSKRQARSPWQARRKLPVESRKARAIRWQARRR